MYHTEKDFVRGQKIKLVVAVALYLIAVWYSGEWLP